MDSFYVIDIIGEGSYGLVLKCRSKKNGEIVAIKRFKRVNSTEYAHRVMLRELRVLNLLKGEPNVVQLLGAFHDNKQLCLVMEYAKQNLLDVIRQWPSGVPLEQLRHLLFTLLIGIRSCHRKGIIHRDVKPENILVHHGCTALLCDFGSSRTVQPPGAMVTTSGGLLQAPLRQQPPLTEYVATRWYRSPEMLLGLPNYSFASDMWAVGAIMAEMAIGEPLFPGNSEVDQLDIIRQRVGEFPEPWASSTISPPLLHTDVGRNAGDHESAAEAGSKEDFLGCTYRGVLGRDGLNLLRSLLSIDPSKRCTAEGSLAHPFLDGLSAEQQTSLLILDQSEGETRTNCDRRDGSLVSKLFKVRDERDKWFGLGEGRLVKLGEIEPFNSANVVMPQTVEVLSTDIAALPASPTIARKDPDGIGAAERSESTSISTFGDCHLGDGARHDSEPPRIQPLQLPSIASNPKFAVVDVVSLLATPSLPSLVLSNVSFTPLRAASPSYAKEPTRLSEESSILSQEEDYDFHQRHKKSNVGGVGNCSSISAGGRGGGGGEKLSSTSPPESNRMPSFVRFPPSFKRDSVLTCSNQGLRIQLGALNRSSMKKKGRLLFTTRMSAENW